MEATGEGHPNAPHHDSDMTRAKTRTAVSDNGHRAGTDDQDTGKGKRRHRQRGTSRRTRPGSTSATSLETAAQAFRMLTTGPAPLSVDGAAVGYGLPRRQIPLDELRAILLHPATGRPARDAIWRHVIEAAHTSSPAWVIGAVGLALPALWAMVGDLGEGYRGEAADLHAAVLTGFVAALHRIDASRPGVITRLRWAAYRAGLLARYTRDGVPSISLPPLESAPPPHPWAHPDLLLADAVAKCVLSPLAAELIGRSRLEGIRLTDAAAELGVGYQAAKKARQRGERRLVAALAAGDVETRMSPPARKSGLSSARTQNSHPTPGPGSVPADGNSRPAGVRGRSTEADGTSTPEDPHPEGGVFCDPAHQPHPHPKPSPRPSRRSRRRSRRRGSGHGGETS